uniref:Phytanoyl-CoA dioxygenase (PhyH) n=1 Tax=Mycobacterium riyadhense TaxID=486698 RepID=A0A653EWP0_9MYCO|nr:Phytanoyl-CoA dioxygenase (PhyH) [Mycobacterium riyadhense]
MTTTSNHNIARLVDDFRQHGFVHVPQLLAEQEITELRAAAHAALTAEHIAKQCAGAGIAATVDGWEHSNILRKWALHPRLSAITGQLAGMPLRVWGIALLKAPNGNRPAGLHDDQTSELLDSRITLHAWVALVDVPVERGCLTFLPGTHRRGGPERIDITGVHLADLEREEPRSYLFDYWPDLRWTPRVTVPLRAGDVTFHHRRSAHSAGANHTSQHRLSMLITYTDADATYQPLSGHDPLPYQPDQPLPDERYPRLGR